LLTVGTERLVAEIRDLFEELARLTRTLVAWNGSTPTPAALEQRIEAIEARVAAIERAIRR